MITTLFAIWLYGSLACALVCGGLLFVASLGGDTDRNAGDDDNL